MRALLLALALATPAAQAWAHAMPNSTAVVQAQPGEVELAVWIPISELKAATDDAPAGEAGAYLLRHVAVVDGDGRAWQGRVRDLQPSDRDGYPVIAAALVFTPRTGGSDRAASLRYDAVTHRIASHFVLVYRKVGDTQVPLGRLQAPDTTLALP